MSHGHLYVCVYYVTTVLCVLCDVVSGGRAVERRTVNRGDGGSIPANPPFRNLGNFVHPTFDCVFRKRH